MKKEKSSVDLSVRQILSMAMKNSLWRAYVARSIVEGLAIVFAVGFLFYDSLLAGLILSPYIFFHMKKRVKFFEMRRKEKIEVSFADAMQAVVSGLVAGYSIENAFREAVQELENVYGKRADIYVYFSRMVSKMGLNTNVEDAFGEFADEVGVEEISRFSEVLSYAKNTGGNLISIIKDTTDSISEKIEVKRDIATVISAKRLEQKIMTVVPAGIIVYMRTTSGEMFDVLYGNAFGMLVMSVCLGIFLVANLWANKLVDIWV